MEFKKTTLPRLQKPGRRGHVKVGDTAGYSHCVQMYKLPPTDTITLEEFEELAVERLKVLKAVETAGVRYNRSSENYTKLLEKEIRETKLKNSIFEKGTLDDLLKQQYRWKDHVSHFILRLAYCASEDLRRWFIQQEVDLFRFRLQQENGQSRADFMVLNELSYHPIDKEEHLEFRTQLNNASREETYHSVDVQFYKVPFTEAFDLVRGRRVFLRQGYAYVPQDDLVSILQTVHRVQLSLNLAKMARMLPHLQENGRLLPMLSSLSRRYVGQDYGNKKPVGEITADMIDMLSKKSFPLCMQQLNGAIRTNHHLRHGGRQQYSLFLKGIGLSLDEAIKFWRMEFTKIIDGDQFDKKYLYNIRHNYGKEGKKTDYTPYSCMKIITTNTPATGDFHGCPFKHSDQDALKQKLKSQGLKKDEVDQVLHYMKGGHYQVACAKVFELIHGSLTGGEEEVEVSFQHPNQYFEESYKRLHKNTADKPSAAPHTPRSVKIVPASSQQTPPPSSSSQSLQSASQLTSQATPPTSGLSQSGGSAWQVEDCGDLDDDFELDEAMLQQIDDASSQQQIDGASSQQQIDDASSQPQIDGASSQPQIDGASSQPQIDDASSKLQIGDASSKPQIGDASSQQQIDGATSQPQIDGASSQQQIGDASSQPQIGDASSEQQIGDASEQQIGDASAQPQIDASSQPQIGDASSQQQIGDASSQQQIDDASSQPQIGDASSKPQIDDASAQPQIDDASSQQQIDDASSQLQIGDASSKPQIDDASAQPQIDDASSQQQIDDASKPQIADASSQQQIGDASSQQQIDDASSQQSQESQSL